MQHAKKSPIYSPEEQNIVRAYVKEFPSKTEAFKKTAKELGRDWQAIRSWWYADAKKVKKPLSAEEKKAAAKIEVSPALPAPKKGSKRKKPVIKSDLSESIRGTFDQVKYNEDDLGIDTNVNILKFNPSLRFKVMMHIIEENQLNDFERLGIIKALMQSTGE